MDVDEVDLDFGLEASPQANQSQTIQMSTEDDGMGLIGELKASEETSHSNNSSYNGVDIVVNTEQSQSSHAAQIDLLRSHGESTQADCSVPSVTEAMIDNSEITEDHVTSAAINGEANSAAATAGVGGGGIDASDLQLTLQSSVDMTSESNTDQVELCLEDAAVADIVNSANSPATMSQNTQEIDTGIADKAAADNKLADSTVTSAEIDIVMAAMDEAIANENDSTPSHTVKPQQPDDHQDTITTNGSITAPADRNMHLDLDSGAVPAICLISPKPEDIEFDYIEPDGEVSDHFSRGNAEDANDIEDAPVTAITDDNPKDNDEFDFDLPAVKPQQPHSTTTKTTAPQPDTSGMPQVTVAIEPSSLDQQHPNVEEVTTAPPAITSITTVPPAHDNSGSGGGSGSLVAVPDVVIQAATPIGPISPTEEEDFKHFVNPQVDMNAEDTNNACAALVDEAAVEDLEAAKDEWDKVHTVTPAFATDDQRASPAKVTDAAGFEPITYADALQKFKESDKRFYKIQPTLIRRGFSAIAHMIFGPPKLNRDLLEDRDLVFYMAACALENHSYHEDILKTIYTKLTGTKFGCMRYGEHFEQIGFQGTDPATDLRGVGMLGLVHLLGFTTNPDTTHLAMEIYTLAQHESQHFPFCVMGMTMSMYVLKVLREETLNKDINRRKCILSMSEDLYAAFYLCWYNRYKQGKSILDVGYATSELEQQIKRNPRNLLRNLEDYITKQKKSAPQPAAEGELAFTKLD